MKKIIYIGAALFLAACSQPKKHNSEEAEQTETTTQEAQKEVTYKIEESSAKVYWTAFKHTAKVGVKGVFDSLMVSGTKEAKTIEEAILGATVEIFTQSVNSKDGGRDAKVREFYFGKMANTEVIKGSILSAEKGKATISLTINETTKELPAKYIVDNGELSLKTTINMNDFNAQEAISELNKVCEERHTGDDGKSVLWPDVEVLVTVNVSEK